MIRGQVSTELAAPLSASRLIGSTRRSAHSYCWESRTMPPAIISSPGPGRTNAAMPTTSSAQPTISRPIRLAAAFMG